MSNDGFIRGHRAKMIPAADDFLVPQEIINEVLKPFIKARWKGAGKYCDYCDPNYDDVLSDMTAQLQKHGETYGLCMRINGKNYTVSINYCPNCGRKLTEEE